MHARLMTRGAKLRKSTAEQRSLWAAHKGISCTDTTDSCEAGEWGQSKTHKQSNEVDFYKQKFDLLPSRTVHFFDPAS